MYEVNPFSKENFIYVKGIAIATGLNEIIKRLKKRKE